jgi:hypothetical protein
MIEKALNFTKEYKQSSFFKKTKMPISDVIKSAKMWYAINLSELFEQLQEKINTLDLSNLTHLANQMADVFETENSEIYNMINEVKDIELFKK